MNDKQLLLDLLETEYEIEAIAILQTRGLFNDANAKRWVALGNMPNNQSVVHAQQSTPAAALVEKFTNGLDAILLRRCKAQDIDPRSVSAPGNMGKAVGKWFGDLSEKSQAEIRALAEENLVLYATGSRQRPCLSIYDAGEGQLPENFPRTFCSLVYGSDEGAYKGAVPFVQGRFNMGGTGVLPFCGDDRKMQLIVSRVPMDVEKAPHEWGFTVCCFFPSRQSPSWKYLVGDDGKILTAGAEPLGLVPKAGAKSGEVCKPRERLVQHGTLIKMYDYKAPRSNICGELFRKLEEYLLRPMMPLRLVECRPEYKANVMQNTVWDRFAAWEAKGTAAMGRPDSQASVLVAKREPRIRQSRAILHHRALDAAALERGSPGGEGGGPGGRQRALSWRVQSYARPKSGSNHFATAGGRGRPQHRAAGPGTPPKLGNPRAAGGRTASHSEPVERWPGPAATPGRIRPHASAAAA